MSDSEITNLMREIRESEGRKCQIYDDLVEGLSYEELREIRSILR